MNTNFAKRLKSYAISESEYWNIINKQNSQCAICKEPLHVGAHIDHDHELGFVRGVLCPKCNMALGLFGEHPGRLIRAADYLLQFSDWYTPDV